MPINVANRLVAKVSRLYAEAAPEDQLALRVWMRDIILGRKKEVRERLWQEGGKADGQGV